MSHDPNQKLIPDVKCEKACDQKLREIDMGLGQ